MIFQKPRNLVSPRPGNPHDSKAPIDENSPLFKEELNKVCEAVVMAKKGRWPDEFLAEKSPTKFGGEIPFLLKDELRLYGTNACRNLAMSVSMDDYWDLGTILFKVLTKQHNIEMRDSIPSENEQGIIRFCDKEASIARFHMELHYDCRRALDRVFDIKFAWRRPRAEDYKEVPGEQFTLDGYGAPQHYGFGAGHAAAAKATDHVLHKMLKLSENAELSQATTHACWSFKFGRMPLGVHFLEDNHEGWRATSTLLNAKPWELTLI